MSSRSRRLQWQFERLVSAYAALLWLAAAAASSLHEGEYYRPLLSESSGRVGTTATYRRSPCPAINALANHGYIPRNGQAITAQALKAAAMKHFNVDSQYADTLVALAKKPVFDLDELSAHNVVEHDMSLVHQDAFFGQDPAAIDRALVADFVGHAGATGVLDPWFFARTQQRRLRDCRTHNPQCEFSNEFLLSVTLGRQGLLMRVMGGWNDEAVDLETATMLLVDEKLAPNWTRSSTPISQNDIQDSRKRLFALLKASGEWLGDGFGTTHQPLVSDARATHCLDVVNTTLVLSSCESRVDAQQFVLDGDQRLVVASSSRCLQVAASSNVSGAVIVEAACRPDRTSPMQRWWYDASGRLRPVHAPDLCLDVERSELSSVAVVMAHCSTRTEQRFFSFYANFQPSASRLASMDAPRFCLGLDAGATTSAALDLSPLVVTPCDTMDDAQELTLDERKRLVFTYDATQCVDVGDNAVVVQKPCSDTTTTWRYDSLSRLHASATPSKCLAFPSSDATRKHVVLTDCTDGLAHKWFITDTRQADVRPADQYYRPNVFEASGKPGTAAAYARSPCPALNTLANHGLLPRSGRNLTAQQVQQAVIDHFNIDPAYAHVLVALANRSVFNLDDLSVHNAAEHDMSLVHADAFFGQDPAVTDPTLAAELLRHVGASGTMDVLFFARTQARRLRQCQARNPQCDFSNEFLMSVALGRLGLLMRGMGGRNENAVDVTRVRAFLVDEKFPTDFTKSPTPITQADIQETRRYVYALLKASSAWLVDGFLNRKTGVSVVSEGSGHALCLEVADGSTDPTALLVVAPCEPTKREQKWLTDDSERLVNEKSGLCLAANAFGTQAGTAVIQLECADDASNQRWTYDSSGRLRPAHAASMCLNVDDNSETNEAAAVVLGDCDATSRQRFYSLFDGFQPNGSHLTSIEAAQLCVGVAGASIDDGAAVEAAPCDPLLLEQQLTIDAGGRLVFQHSNQCLATATTTTNGKSVVQAACEASTSQLWAYDSLGRLHAVAARGQCVTLRSGDRVHTNSTLTLADCSDAGAQRWYASDASDPNSRPQNAYYRPNRDESSGVAGTTATYSRSPCPALNALANHGIISRDGRNISRSDLVGAAVATFHLEPALAEAMLADVHDDIVSLDQLSSAAMVQYTGSLLHSDAFFNPDPAAVDPDLVRDLFARVGSDGTVDLVYFAAAQRRRLDTHARTTGTAASDTTLSPSKILKPGLVLRVMGGKNEETLDAETAKLLLVEERLPDDDVTKPASPVTLSDVRKSASKLEAIVETGGTSASGEGGASVAWLSQPFVPRQSLIYALRDDGSDGRDDGVRCLSLANGAATLQQCNATARAQRVTYDPQQRLAVVEGDGATATWSCLDVVDGKVGRGAAVSHVDCTDWPHQQWIYDASGRLHPQHAPKFCLSVASTAGVHGVLTTCDDRNEQRFFAAFATVARSDTQLVSAAPSTTNGRTLTHCLSRATVSSSGDNSLGVAPCDAASVEQRFSLDETQRLVVSGTNQCVVIAEDTASVVLSDCSGTGVATDPSVNATASQWIYDSLGRLHVARAMARCLVAGTTGTATEPVTVAPCSQALSQRWLVARLTAPTPNASIGGVGPGRESAAGLPVARVALVTVTLLVLAGLVV